MDPRTSTLPAGRAKDPDKIREKPNLCPFGCGDNRLDEHGYCRHLVGFTLDRKTMECRERMPHHSSYERVGNLVEPVRRSDVIVRVVNPVSDTFVSTMRVYRKGGTGPVLAEPNDTRLRKRLDINDADDDEDLNDEVDSELDDETNEAGPPAAAKVESKPPVA